MIGLWPLHIPPGVGAQFAGTQSKREAIQGCVLSALAPFFAAVVASGSVLLLVLLGRSWRSWRYSRGSRGSRLSGCSGCAVGRSVQGTARPLAAVGIMSTLRTSLWHVRCVGFDGLAWMAAWWFRRGTRQGVRGLHRSLGADMIVAACQRSGVDAVLNVVCDAGAGPREHGPCPALSDSASGSPADDVELPTDWNSG